MTDFSLLRLKRPKKGFIGGHWRWIGGHRRFQPLARNDRAVRIAAGMPGIK
jgi:hypothetical protein